jgi:hypothetical protein
LALSSSPQGGPIFCGARGFSRSRLAVMRIAAFMLLHFYASPDSRNADKVKCLLSALPK